MSIFDSAPGSGAVILGFLLAAITYATQRLKAANKRLLRDAQNIPPSDGNAHPSPAADRAILARLDRAEQHDALTTALLRERWLVTDRDREISELRRALAERSLQLELEQAGHAIVSSQLRARDELIARLRAELQRERQKRRPAPVEVTEAEYRDASQAGPLQDAIKTPIRPPAKR